jgi:hypothetical protein
VKKLSQTETVLDEDFRETRQNRVYQAEFEVIGQVVGLEPMFALQRTATGDMVPNEIHFVFRTKDMDEQGVVFEKGDRIVQIEEIRVDLNIIQVTRASPFGGNREKAFARPILIHVTAEQQRKELGSI